MVPKKLDVVLAVSKELSLTLVKKLKRQEHDWPSEIENSVENNAEAKQIWVEIIEFFERTFAHTAHVHQAHMRTLQIY